MEWYVISSLNDGYVYNGGIIVTSLWGEVHNYYRWRIDKTKEINEGYPYFYTIVNIIPSTTEDDDGDIIDTSSYSGAQTTARQCTHDTLTSSRHDFDITTSGLNAVVASACNVYVMNSGQLSVILDAITDAVSGGSGLILDFLQNMQGTNIFDGLVSCRAYPFSVTPSTLQTNIKLMNFTFTLSGSPLIYSQDTGTQYFDFGTVNLGISEGWHLVNCTYQIYLPFVGILDLPIHNNNSISLYAHVDLLQGVITYIVKDTESSVGEVLLIASGNIGIDVPVNLSQAIQNRNLRGNIIGLIRGAFSDFNNAISSIGGTIAGNAVGTATTSSGDKVGNNGISGSANAMGAMSNTRNNLLNMATPTQQPPTYQVIFNGNDNTIASLDMTPKIMVKKPQSYNNSTGFNNFHGLQFQKYYATLADLAGEYIQCSNYQITNNNLTATEKDEIKRLMENGVIL